MGTMTKSYTDATVTLSDGRQLTFSQVEIQADQSLIATNRYSFTPQPPMSYTEADLKRLENCGEATETIHFSGHAWLSITQPKRGTLCVATWDGGRTPSSIAVVHNDLPHDVDVSALINTWLKDHVAKWDGGFQGDYGQGRHQPPQSVSPNRNEALRATYVLFTTGANPQDRGRVRFWLEELPTPRFDV